MRTKKLRKVKEEKSYYSIQIDSSTASFLCFEYTLKRFPWHTKKLTYKMLIVRLIAYGNRCCSNYTSYWQLANQLVLFFPSMTISPDCEPLVLSGLPVPERVTSNQLLLILFLGRYLLQRWHWYHSQGGVCARVQSLLVHFFVMVTSFKALQACSSYHL